MAALRKPKKLKLPKKPKQTASNEVMERYLKKVAEVKKDNAKRESTYKSAVKKRETLKKKIASLTK